MNIITTDNVWRWLLISLYFIDIWTLFRNKKCFLFYEKRLVRDKKVYEFLFFQFHIQLFSNCFTLESRETMMYYAKEFKILQLRKIITRWSCRIIQVLGYSTQCFRNMIIQVFRVKLQFLCRFNYPTIRIIEFKNFA